MRIGYARVSKDYQHTDLQMEALKKAGCDRIFEEHSSGAKENRPELAKLLDMLRPMDTLVVWKLDRLCRSIRHLIEIGLCLQRMNVQLLSLTEAIDTSTAMGKFTFHLLGAMAEFERALIIERTKAGLAVAHAKGNFGGRKKLDPKKVALAKEMYFSKKYSLGEIAQLAGVSPASLFRYLEIDRKEHAKAGVTREDEE